MRSTLRRNAMTTPASVHCMSRQLMFSDLSCTGFRRKIWHPRHHCLVTIHIISHWISCSSWDFWIWILRSFRFGPCRHTPILNLQTVASHQSCFLLVSCRCCTRCSLGTQLCNLGIENLSTPSGSKHQVSLQQSNLCGTCNLWHHTTQDSTLCRVVSNRQQWFAHWCLNTSNSEIRSPIVATRNLHSFAIFDKLSSCCAESEITVTRNRRPLRDILRPCRLSCTCVDSNLDPFRHCIFSDSCRSASTSR